MQIPRQKRAGLPCRSESHFFSVEEPFLQEELGLLRGTMETHFSQASVSCRCREVEWVLCHLWSVTP